MKKLLASVLLSLVFGTSVFAAEVPEDTPEQIEEEIREDELQMLAILVMAEAGNQDMKGKQLVVDVVLNRVDDPGWPDTISEVINQPWQFSPMKDGGFERAAKTVTEDCFTAVALELEGRLDYSIHYFCAGGYSSYGTRAYKYGDHYFNY